MPASTARLIVSVRKSPFSVEIAMPSTRWVMNDSRISFCRSWSAVSGARHSIWTLPELLRRALGADLRVVEHRNVERLGNHREAQRLAVAAGCAAALPPCRRYTPPRPRPPQPPPSPESVACSASFGDHGTGKRENGKVCSFSAGCCKRPLFHLPCSLFHSYSPRFNNNWSITTMTMTARPTIRRS